MNEDEEKLDEKIKEFVEINLKNVFKNRINTIKQYLNTNCITLEQAIQEVQNKTSKLSANCRTALIALRPEVITRWLNENNENHAENKKTL